MSTLRRLLWGRPNERMIVDYHDDLRLFPTRARRAWLVFLVVGWIFLPALWDNAPFTLLSDNGVSLNTLAYAGVFAIAAIGLNLLTGYTGQVSLGHSVFLAVGAYFTAYAGSTWDMPMWQWLIIAPAVGWVVGAAVGPFALRLRGNYLVVVTLGLVFIGEHIFRNWKSVTGGSTGTSAATVPMEIGPLDVRSLEIFGRAFDEDRAFFWLIWLVVGIVAWLVKNVVRSRPGRAMQAVRDRDMAAEIIGIDVGILGYKTQAFAWSAAIAALAGALYAPLQLFIGPGDFGLLIAIQFIAMIILGGMGTIYGSIIGALIITAMPRLIEGYSSATLPLVGRLPLIGDQFVGGLPGVAAKTTDDGLISVSSLNVVIYGLLIAMFLLVEQRGLAGIWVRVRNYFSTWPFSY
jgi:branched-chain amino acid transport system permease protein